MFDMLQACAWKIAWYVMSCYWEVHMSCLSRTGMNAGQSKENSHVIVVDHHRPPLAVEMNSLA